MVTIVLVPTTTKSCLQVLTIVIVQRSHHTIEVVVHLLLAHQVTRRPSFLWVQIILKKGALALILLIVAVALGVVQGSIQVQHVRKALVPDELVVLLVVVVRLVVIIAGVTLLVIVLPTRVVSAPI